MNTSSYKHIIVRVFFLGSILSLVSTHLFAGKNDTTIFALPMEEPVDLSANFAELRQNHFHGGLDFRTGGQEGKPIFSIADGYVSRIRIDSKGYGNQIYITHPNGYISSYAHLLSFSDKITKYIQKYQYLNEKNMIDVKIPINDLMIKRCDLIGISGNTGSSRGPHLHFEIQEVASGKIINPLIFYPQIKDIKSPIINAISVYPLSDESSVNGNNKSMIVGVNRTSANADYGIMQSLVVKGKIGFAIQATDYMNNYYHIFGVYKVQLFMDSVLVYEHKMDKIKPWEQRAINSYVDYSYYLKSKNFLQKSYVDPFNKLGIYSKLNNNRGIFTFDKAGIHQMKYVVTDFHGNKSTVNFKITVNPNAIVTAPTHLGNPFPCTQHNTYYSHYFKAYFPMGSMFNDFYFTSGVDSVPKVSNGLSAIVKISDAVIPIRDSVFLSIRLKKNIDEKYYKKLLIAQYLGPNSTSPVGGKYDTGFVTVQIKNFAKYLVIIDTIPPVVLPTKVYDRANLSTKAGMFFTIGDRYSGIGKFNMWIDDKWVIMYYDQKTSMIVHWFNPARMEYGKWHNCKLVVEDNRGNAKTLNFTFYK